jgi:hypothetical protein
VDVKTEFYADLKPEGKFKKQLLRIKLYNLEKTVFPEKPLVPRKNIYLGLTFFQ